MHLPKSGGTGQRTSFFCPLSAPEKPQKGFYWLICIIYIILESDIRYVTSPRHLQSLQAAISVDAGWSHRLRNGRRSRSSQKTFSGFSDAGRFHGWKLVHRNNCTRWAYYTIRLFKTVYYSTWNIMQNDDSWFFLFPFDLNRTGGQ